MGKLYYFGVRKLVVWFLFSSSFPVFFCTPVGGLSPHKKKKEMAQAFDPLGGGGGPKKKKTTVKESAQISEITEDDDESNDPFSPANIGGGSGGFTWKHDTRMCI